MAKLTRYSVATRNAVADAMAARIAGGKLALFTDPRPASADTAVTTQTKLAEMDIPDPAAIAAANGVAVLVDLEGATILATGTATWGRYLDAGGAAVMDGSVGTADADIVIGAVSLVKDADLLIESGSITAPASI